MTGYIRNAQYSTSAVFQRKCYATFTSLFFRAQFELKKSKKFFVDISEFSLSWQFLVYYPSFISKKKLTTTTTTIKSMRLTKQTI